MKVVGTLDELGFLERRYLPRVTLRFEPHALIAVADPHSHRVSSIVTLVREGGRTMLAGVGRDQVRDPTAFTLDLFSRPADGDSERAGLLAQFLRRVLHDTPRGRAGQRSVVIVEQLDAIEALLAGSAREVVVEAVREWGAAAAVVVR